MRIRQRWEREREETATNGLLLCFISLSLPPSLSPHPSLSLTPPLPLSHPTPPSFSPHPSLSLSLSPPLPLFPFCLKSRCNVLHWQVSSQSWQWKRFWWVSRHSGLLFITCWTHKWVLFDWYSIPVKPVLYFIELHEELGEDKDVVEFDFLGKDSIRYYNRVPVSCME